MRSATRTAPIFHSFILCLALFVSLPALACGFKPKTDLEKVYCAIEDRGAAGGLPSIFEFRKNPPQTQALLLEKTARRLGIAMPQPPPKPTPKPPIKTTPPPVENTAPPVKQQPAISAVSTLAECQLDKASIQCGADTYLLQTNLQNRQLGADALTEKNRLALPGKNSPAYRDKTVQVYLSGVYPYYLEKMMEIGLADATLSYTKFAAMYDDITRQEESFSGRFDRMYELLKTERKSNAVKARYNNNYPASIKLCMSASATLLVCDDIQQNWIYKKIGD